MHLPRQQACQAPHRQPPLWCLRSAAVRRHLSRRYMLPLSHAQYTLLSSLWANRQDNSLLYLATSEPQNPYQARPEVPCGEDLLMLILFSLLYRYFVRQLYTISSPSIERPILKSSWFSLFLLVFGSLYSDDIQRVRRHIQQNAAILV